MKFGLAKKRPPQKGRSYRAPLHLCPHGTGQRKVRPSNCDLLNLATLGADSN